ncbi:hypothetical protein [Notoacmeibacter ruber]|uniref:Uncharacterized protein n=1 Tax=Notoacmeibacter ruber TaxID=2670375 RepID=A0A3L7JL20_9HYPH|nr:hypothetical protein [Notoacmeibacter ruber]RLQ89212.1 hypothetical protein D8780_14150 [Notoacmeibacter ruber]
MSPSARIDRSLSIILEPLLGWAILGTQIGLYTSTVFAAILAYGSFVVQRVYPFIETLLHFSLALLVASVVPLLFDRVAKRLRRRAARSNGKVVPALVAIGLSVCAVGALFCLPLLEPLYDAISAMVRDGLEGRLQSDDPARMPLSAWITFLCFSFFLLVGLLLSLRHSFGLMADMRRPVGDDIGVERDTEMQAEPSDQPAAQRIEATDEILPARPWDRRADGLHSTRRVSEPPFKEPD